MRDLFSGYILLKGDEGGNPVRFLSEEDLRDLLAHPRDTYGITEFGSMLPDNHDHNYWPDGFGLLLKAEIVQPVRFSGYRLPDEDD